ncbi:hypothetical protein ACQP1W_30190 [Spirillospora sp. CA-255316]
MALLGRNVDDVDAVVEDVACGVPVPRSDCLGRYLSEQGGNRGGSTGESEGGYGQAETGSP